MQKSLPTRAMREHPDLDQLKRQAKELHDAFIAGLPDAVAEVNTHYRNADPATFALHHAQLVLARAYGFDSWPKLKAYVDGVTVTRLADAVRAGDVEQARAMLKARPELVNMQMSYGDEHRALHYAVTGRAPEMARLLMESGADAHAGIHPHRDATTALTLAIERGYDEIVAILQEEEQRRRKAGSGLDAAATSTPDELCEAIGRGDEARAIAMLEADPSLTHTNNRDGWTPLHVAAGALNERLAQYLLERGADATRRGKDDQTPMDMAATGSGRRKAGGAAAFASVAKILRRHGAELTARSAVALGEAGWLRARHAEGALENPLDWSMGGLLTIAVHHDRLEILELLLDLGFDPDERIRLSEVEGESYSQGYPLWQCAAQGKYAMAEILLKRGANPNAHVDSSGSAVYSAYSHRQWAMVELLRRYGGVVAADTVAIYRQTELARRMLADEAAGLLPEGSKMVEELLHFGASGGDPEIVRMALERVDWPHDDPRWFRILGEPLSFWNHIPWLYAGNPELDRGTYITCFRLILERSDPNLIGGFNRTILHEVAAMGGHVTEEEGAPFASALLDAGARMDVCDDLLKSTPLGWACRWGRIEVVKLLLERGADPVEADAEPWATPRAWAEKMGHDTILALLDVALNS
ncbi:MAG: ankyrin repeat domain-containing protein [Blastocatellales bacterium]